MNQSFINRILGQASLLLEFDAASRTVSEKIRIPGLLPASELPDLVWKIRDAAQKIRQGNYVKGIIT